MPWFVAGDPVQLDDESRSDTAFLAFIIGDAEDVLMMRREIGDAHVLTKPRITAGNGKHGDQFIGRGFSERAHAGEVEIDRAIRVIDVIT